MPQILINTVQGNKGMQWNFALTDSAGVAANLTGATLVFSAQLESDLTVQFSNAMGVTSAVAGTCYYTVQTNDLLVAGTYNCQIIATFTSTGEVITWADIQLIVEASVPVPSS